MNFQVKFKSIDHSNSLVEYVEQKFSKLSKYEMKPLRVKVTFSEERHSCSAQVYIHGLHKEFTARHSCDSFYVALDFCLKKIERQLEREKSRIKSHHHYEHSAEAQLEALSNQEERAKDAA
jgi:ribosomal subunit interface protein